MKQPRLDRVYLNYHLEDQLDHEIRCTALPWVSSLISSHRPLWFEWRPPEPHQDTIKAIPEWVIREADLQ